MPKKKTRLYDELVQAFDELKQWKEGKITLKTYTVEPTPKPEVTPEITGYAGAPEPISCSFLSGGGSSDGRPVFFQVSEVVT